MLISIGSRLDQVWAAGVSVHTVALRLGFPELEAYQIELATVEVVNNAIQHARRGPGQSVDIVLGASEGLLSIDISDDGRPAPADRLNECVREAGGASGDPEPDLIESGRGLVVLNQIMQQITYYRAAQRNHVRMVRRIPQPTNSLSASI
jgi:anti-sigma regulatory factor (Ser/Thr protein kinase)